MENTNTIQFPNDQAEWFYSVGEQFRGPFKASEIYQKLQANELSWIDYCYREKEGQWIRIADQAVFMALQPQAPKPKPVMAPPPPPKKEDETKWFLFQNEAQTGPYGTSELQRLASAGQILPAAFVWTEKFTDWKPYQDVVELKTAGTPPPAPAHVVAAAAAIAASTPVSNKPAEKRAAPRKPLVAQIYVTDHANLSTGICRDISVGGMQVLTETVPGNVGTSIRFNVAPPQDSGLQPFVAEGTIVRVLEDQRGFSFRFTQLSDTAKKSIESYIA